MVDGILTLVLLVAGVMRWLLASDHGMDQSRIDGLRDRRLGGPGQAAMFDRALESGIVPSSANKLAWLRELQGVREPTSLHLRVLELVIMACIVGKFMDDVRTGTVEDLIRFAWIAAGGAALYGAWLLFLRIRGDKEADKRAKLQSTLESQTLAYRVVSDVGPRQKLRRVLRRVR